jgi:hypothetical protein
MPLKTSDWKMKKKSMNRSTRSSGTRCRPSIQTIAKQTLGKRNMVDGVGDFVQRGLFGSDVDNVLRIQDRQHTEHSCNAVDAPTLLLEGAAFLFDLLHRSWLGRNWSVHC